MDTKMRRIAWSGRGESRILMIKVGFLFYCCMLAAVGAASERVQSSDVRDRYLQVIEQTQSDLEAGTLGDTRQRLESTDKSQRRFEFDYLQMRLRKASGEGKSTPDLIHFLARPTVDTRYGVLNAINRQLVFICRDGTLRIHDLTDLNKPPLIVKHPQDSTIWSGVFSHDDKTFFSGHQNGEVLVWDAATWKIRHTVTIDNAWPVRELAAAPDGSAFVAESKSELELWSLSEDHPLKVLKVGDRYNFGEGLAFSPKGDTLATGGMFDIHLFDAKTGHPLRSMRHASYTMGLEFSPDGKRIASAPRGNVNKFLAVFEVSQDEPLFNAGPFGNYIAGIAFSPDGKRIAATGCEKQVRLFDADSGQIVLTFKRTECGSKPAFTRDGRLLGWNEPDGYYFIDLGPTQKPTSTLE